MKPVRAMARRSTWAHAVELVFYSVDANGSRCVGEPLTMRYVDDSSIVRDPTVSLSVTHAQELMDELWACGLRPSEGTGSAGAMAATQKHLEDMRKLVGKRLGVILG